MQISKVNSAFSFENFNNTRITLRNSKASNAFNSERALQTSLDNLSFLGKSQVQNAKRSGENGKNIGLQKFEDGSYKNFDKNGVLRFEKSKTTQKWYDKDGKMILELYGDKEKNNGELKYHTKGECFSLKLQESNDEEDFKAELEYCNGDSQPVATFHLSSHEGELKCYKSGREMTMNIEKKEYGSNPSIDIVLKEQDGSIKKFDLKDFEDSFKKIPLPKVIREVIVGAITGEIYYNVGNSMPDKMSKACELLNAMNDVAFDTLDLLIADNKFENID